MTGDGIAARRRRLGRVPVNPVVLGDTAVLCVQIGDQGFPDVVDTKITGYKYDDGTCSAVGSEIYFLAITGCCEAHSE